MPTQGVTSARVVGVEVECGVEAKYSAVLEEAMVEAIKDDEGTWQISATRHPCRGEAQVRAMRMGVAQKEESDVKADVEDLALKAVTAVIRRQSVRAQGMMHTRANACPERGQSVVRSGVEARMEPEEIGSTSAISQRGMRRSRRWRRTEKRKREEAEEYD